MFSLTVKCSFNLEIFPTVEKYLCSSFLQQRTELVSLEYFYSGLRPAFTFHQTNKVLISLVQFCMCSFTQLEFIIFIYSDVFKL